MADFLGLMKQAAEFKSKMEAMQTELDAVEVDGVAGGGLVRLQLSGKGELKSVGIDPSLLKPEEAGVLADLLVAAHADGRRKAEAVMQEKMKSVAGGLPLPPGLNPF
jgi:DNA-binding YbaB/EbfC family protein